MHITDTIVALWIWNKISLLGYTARSIADSSNRNRNGTLPTRDPPYCLAVPLRR